jgi:hypothetical protein
MPSPTRNVGSRKEKAAPRWPSSQRTRARLRLVGGMVDWRPAEAACAALATLQYGLVERGQARARGMPAAAIDRRVASGAWIRVHERVYRLPGAPLTWEQRLLAACLAAGPGAVASHRSAVAPVEAGALRRGIHRANDHQTSPSPIRRDRSPRQQDGVPRPPDRGSHTRDRDPEDVVRSGGRLVPLGWRGPSRMPSDGAWYRWTSYGSRSSSSACSDAQACRLRCASSRSADKRR